MSVGASLKGVALGIVGLSALDLLTASKNGPAVFGTVTAAPAAWLDAWFDAKKPLIPDLRTASSGSGSGGSGGSGGKKCIPIPVPGAQDYCAGVNGTPNCDGLFGDAKKRCLAGQASATTPNTTLPPTSSTARALSA